MTTEEAIRQIEEENRKKADGLEVIAEMMAGYCKVLRGEEQDLTGFGQWNIICTNLEMVMGVKITRRQ